MNGDFLVKGIKTIKKDKFLSNSFIFFLGGFLSSLGGYFFHFLMVRMLSVENYGELQSLLAASVIFSIPISCLSTVLLKYTAHFKAKGEKGKIYSLFSLFTRRLLIVVFLFSFFFFLFSGFIADFLNLRSVLPVVILGLSFLPSFLSSVNRGILQGLERFASLSGIGLAEVSLKILLAFLLVKIGWQVNGALGAIVLAGAIGYFITFLPLKFLFQGDKKKESIETREIIRYFFPTFFALLFINLFYNIDIVLAKHFLSPYLAGQYGALTLIGHIIFFIAGPIVSVMFPMTAAAYANNNNPSKILKKTIALVGLIGLTVLASYFFFPDLIIKILVGEKFLSLNNLLGWFGIAMFFYSLIVVFTQFFLSLHKTKCFYLLAVGVFLQAVAICFCHQTLWQIVAVMNVAMLITLALLLIYYFRTKKIYA